MITAAVILFVAAAAFVAAELFLPSHGVLGVCAIGCALASVFFAYRSSAVAGFLFGMAVVVMAPMVFYWAIQIYPKTPVGKRVILDSPVAAAGSGFSREEEKLSELLGKKGVAMTMLRPAGTIELDGQRIDAVSEAEVIDANTPVEVIRVSGLKVIVKAVG